MTIGPLPVPAAVTRLMRVVAHEATVVSRTRSEPRRPARVVFYTRSERRTPDPGQSA